jgi:carbonic anhydrase
MRLLDHLFDNNRAWAQRIKEREPDFFQKLARQQNPEYLWIGCSDARVPANDIVGLLPGELFVHRNVANVVVHTDLNCLSVVQFAIDVLMVRHIIICGHYGCGGVKAVLEDREHGLIDNWLRHIEDVYLKYKSGLDDIADLDQRVDKLCELNVVEQVENLCRTTLVQNAWKNGQALAVHGLIYRVDDGLLRDLNLCVTGLDEVPSIYSVAGRISNSRNVLR